MPELPEVENVKLSLRSLGATGQTFSAVELRRPNLRTPLRRDLAKKLPGQTVMAIERRAKFLLFQTEDFQILSHLGMTGSWRPVKAGEALEKHDHVVFNFKSGMKLVFNDPRRFGLLELSAKSAKNRWLDGLGPEPFSEEFSGRNLFEQTRGIKAPIKNFIMDQKRVVGVGNIYASEALFQAKIRPSRPASRLKAAEADLLVESIRRVLQAAIAAGGSTIRDYRNSNGESGSFQAQFSVYGRAGERCVSCGSPVKAKMFAGRNTFWCAKCQL